MDTDAPVLIRNVSQSLTASVSHSLGQKKEKALSFSLLPATQYFDTLTHSVQMFQLSHLNDFHPGSGSCGVLLATLWSGLRAGAGVSAESLLDTR